MSVFVHILEDDGHQKDLFANIPSKYPFKYFAEESNTGLDQDKDK